MMSNSESFPINDTVTLTVKVRVDDVLTNATMACLVENPDGDDSNPSVNSVSTGIYSITITPTVAGYWKFFISATGAAAGVRDGTFYVHTSGIVAD